MNKVLSLLESELSFDLVAKKFDENISTTNLEKNRWVMVDNLDDDLKSVLNQLGVGEIKSNIKNNCTFIKAFCKAAINIFFFS